MTISRSLKVATLSLVTIALTAGVSFAAQTAWMDDDANVKKNPKSNSQTVNWVNEGQKVKVVSCQGSWCKLQIPGDDGWVRKSDIDFNNYKPYPNKPHYGPGYGYGYGPGYGYGFGGSACVGGKNASFCIGY